MPATNRDRLLGFLASTFVISHHEVAATTSVAYLIGRSPCLEQALRDLIATRSGVALDVPLQWTAEKVLPSGVRPDPGSALDNDGLDDDSLAVLGALAGSCATLTVDDM